MEVIKIKCDSDCKAKFNEACVPRFYKYLPVRLETTRKFAYEIISMFGSTYCCEQLFTIMKGNKSPLRSRITDIHLGSVLKITTTNNISPEIDNIVDKLICRWQKNVKFLEEKFIYFLCSYCSLL